ncbi:LacI family DNA-binding transcriptional regulator [Desertivirga xinjiangensis]|uniref:LacI family DNA-binding transcriptional regulator n=1 Tax=Desertivirga xinjiangensis TaxID=539206 RepID=UPI00210A5FE9|nr:LacI family DNA-binding transcriptional regulator [Pedobacter xinjiangensis]
MSKITIKELAQKLNLSISTVSRALSDSYETSEETKKKVKALAEQLGYQPDLYASNLRSRKSKTIGVIIPEITNSFFSLAINGIEEIAREKGYHVLIYLTHESYQQELSISRLLLDGRVDGVLMSVSSETTDVKHLADFNERKIPVVLFDRIHDGYKTLKVGTDDYQSGFRSALHLIQKGCKNLAYLSISKQLCMDKRRMKGFLDAVKKFEIRSRVVYCHQDDAGNEKVLSGLLSAEDAPDGIFASVEKLGVAVYEVCNKLSVSIPEKLKVISFSNLKMAPLLQPPLTTITQPAFEIGKQATVALFKALKNNFIYEEDEEIIIRSELIVRRSTE